MTIWIVKLYPCRPAKLRTIPMHRCCLNLCSGWILFVTLDIGVAIILKKRIFRVLLKILSCKILSPLWLKKKLVYFNQINRTKRNHFGSVKFLRTLFVFFFFYAVVLNISLSIDWANASNASPLFFCTSFRTSRDFSINTIFLLCAVPTPAARRRPHGRIQPRRNKISFIGRAPIPKIRSLFAGESETSSKEEKLISKYFFCCMHTRASWIFVLARVDEVGLWS